MLYSVPASEAPSLVRWSQLGLQEGSIWEDPSGPGCGFTEVDGSMWERNRSAPPRVKASYSSSPPAPCAGTTGESEGRRVAPTAGQAVVKRSVTAQPLGVVVVEADLSLSPGPRGAQEAPSPLANERQDSFLPFAGMSQLCSHIALGRHNARSCCGAEMEEGLWASRVSSATLAFRCPNRRRQLQG